MAELIPDDEWRASHNVGHEAFFMDTYRLLCHFLASQPIAALEHDSRGRSFGSSYEKQEISKLLINIASYYRVKYDDGSWEHAKWLHDNFNGVGTLVKNIEQPEETEELDFKEACNKIIHAKKVHFDVGDNSTNKIQYLNPFLYLYGSYHKKEWKVILDIVEFCRAAQKVIV